MQLIPYLFLYEEDELLYSWVYRLAQKNGFSSLRKFANGYIYPNLSDDAKRRKYVKYDYDEQFNLFWKALGIDHYEDEVDTFLNTTMYSGRAPFMSSSLQTQYINMAFRKRGNKSTILTVANTFISELKICPKCFEEELTDKGFFYYHRAHQMPGVEVCHKHGCVLNNYEGKKGHEFEINPIVANSFSETDDSIKKKYAMFCKEFLNKRFPFDILHIKKIIYSKLKELGYTSDKYDELLSNMSKKGYLTLFTKDLVKFLKVTLVGAKYVDANTCLVMLFYLFENVEEITKYINYVDVAKYVFFDKAKNDGYTLVSKYREDIIKLSHDKCKYTFCTTVQGFIQGWRCPNCDSDKSDDEIFRKILRESGDGKYELLGKYESIDKKVLLRHKTCEKEYRIKPRAFIYDDARCLCETILTEKKVRESIECLGDFKLLRFEGGNQKVVIYHEGCGREFQCSYYKFIKSGVSIK